jgi:hypothetical protein
VRKAPDTNYVLAIAAALGVPVERVRDAVFEQYYGYVPSNGRTTSVGVADFDEIVDGDPDLDAESKDLLKSQYQMLKAASAYRRGAKARH